MADKCKPSTNIRNNWSTSKTANGASEPKTSRSNRSRTKQRPLSDAISDEELKKMKLSASACKTANFKIRKDVWTAFAQQTDSNDQHPTHPCALRANETFFIKSTDWNYYGQHLGFRSDIRTSPGAICPDPEMHEERLLLQSDLPLACPSCWSAQRNALPPLRL